MNLSSMKTQDRLVSFSLCLFLFIGCGESGPKTYPVKGKVTYKGQPLEGAGVTFHPTSNGNPAVGQTNAQGEFVLMTYDVADGAVVGSYTVTVTKSAGGETAAVPSAGKSDPADELKKSIEMSEKMSKQQTGGLPPPMTNIKPLLPAKYSKKESTPLKATVSDSKPNVFSFPVDD